MIREVGKLSSASPIKQLVSHIVEKLCQSIMHDNKGVDCGFGTTTAPELIIWLEQSHPASNLSTLLSSLQC